jgi:hypothetical protein
VVGNDGRTDRGVEVAECDVPVQADGIGKRPDFGPEVHAAWHRGDVIALECLEVASRNSGGGGDLLNGQIAFAARASKGSTKCVGRFSVQGPGPLRVGI